MGAAGALSQWESHLYPIAAGGSPTSHHLHRADSKTTSSCHMGDDGPQELGQELLGRRMLLSCTMNKILLFCTMNDLAVGSRRALWAQEHPAAVEGGWWHTDNW